MPIVKVQLKSPSDKSWSQRTPTRNTRDRLLKPLNSATREGDIHTGMSTFKSNGSLRSVSKRSESSTSHLKNPDSRFEMQHENMMSRQQFRTNTSRSISKTRTPKENGSLYGTQSYDSGFSHISRKSDPIPQTILRPEPQNAGSGREEHIHNVKVIIAGRC